MLVGHRRRAFFIRWLERRRSHRENRRIAVDSPRDEFPQYNFVRISTPATAVRAVKRLADFTEHYRFLARDSARLHRDRASAHSTGLGVHDDRAAYAGSA